MTANEQGANAIAGRWITIPRTLIFVRNGSDLLLMKRAPHKRIFPNRYNGLGGHIERDEDVFSAAQREVLEESGLVVDQLHLCGIHNIDVGEATGIVLFVFLATTDKRDLVYTPDEGTLHWIPIAELDQYDLVEDLPLILPRILAIAHEAPPYFAYVTYDTNDQIQIFYGGSR